MNSKERVRKAIRRERPDKVPLGFYVVDYDTIERVIGRPTYVRNKVKSQIAFWEGRRDEVVESYKTDTVEFYRKIDLADIICCKEAAIVPPKGYEPEDPPRQISDDMWRDAVGRVYKVSHISNELICVEDPTERAPRIEDYEFPVQVDPPDPSVFEAFDYVVEQLGPERYIAGPSGGMVAMVMDGGMENALLTYALTPEVVEAETQWYLEREDQMDAYYIWPGQDGVLFEQDMASTRGPLISPRMFREFCLEPMKERVAHVKQYGMDVLLHNCGNNRLFMEWFAQAGIKCYQSLQTNADMNVADLKAEYGHIMAFWGGVSLDVLIAGEPEDVRREVREAMEAGAPGGGFILGPSHSIAKGTKYENFMAMLDEFDHLRDRF